ncbi:MAG: ABC transporter permease subunit [Rhodospirillaceae bacterium]|nr:ABC transporter permease subunit [Rhodospirillaceae bacterium]
MTTLALRLGAVPRGYYWLIWAALGVATVVLWTHPEIAKWLVKYPRSMFVPLIAWINDFKAATIDYVTPLTRAIAAVIELPFDLLQALLAKGFTNVSQEVVFPRLSWLGIIGAMTIAGYALGGLRVALISFLCFAYLAIIGKWDSAMLTLASVALCVPIGIVCGLVFGILCFRFNWLYDWVIRPSLDVAQTMPAFAYLVPVLLLFGNGPVPAMVATVIFATPPMVRATKLALEQVPEEITSMADMFGCTSRQRLWRVMVPTAKPLLLVGINQVIMMSLNMVIIASMIGAGGLGYDVLVALRRLDIGPAMEVGFAIVVIAIALDRMSLAAAHQAGRWQVPQQSGFMQRHPFVVLASVVLLVTTFGGMVFDSLATVPDAIIFSTEKMLDDAVAWINVTFYDQIEAVKVWLILNLLNPFKALLVGLPWVSVVAATGLLGYQLGGWRLAVLVTPLILFPVLVGLWEKTMIAVYLCSISVFFAALIGIPVGAWASTSDWRNRVATIVIDTLQTIPIFVFIIPAVMLFGIGDVSAMIAIVLFAVTTAIRYTNHGLRQVPPHLVEAARAVGCTQRQIFWRVKLPLAMPEIMLGINQTLLMGLAMLIITAMIGTRDLGQEVFIGLAKADIGRGMVAGFCVAFLGIVADRLIVAGAKRLKQRLGLPDE